MSKPKVAVFGINGTLGKPILQALTSSQFSENFNLPIIAITRDASQQKDSKLVVYRQASMEDRESLDKAVENVDVLINVGPPTVPAKDLNAVLDAAVKAGVRLYIPPQFGPDIDEFRLPVIDSKKDHSIYARKIGLKTVDIVTGIFAFPGGLLYDILDPVGYDAKANKIIFVGDEHLKFPISKLEDIAKVVTIIAFKDPSTIPDKIRIYSDETTAENVVARYESTKNVKFEREHKNLQVAWKEAEALIKKYGLRREEFLHYMHVSTQFGPGYGLVFPENEREYVNPNESLFKWSKF